MKGSNTAGILKPVSFLVPLAIAALTLRAIPEVAAKSRAPEITVIAASQAAELERIFDALDYRWPPATPGSEHHAVLPAIAVRKMPADIDALSVDARKAMFFRVLAPLIAAENRKLREQREFLLHVFEEYSRIPDSGAIASRVRNIARHFEVAGDLDLAATRQQLLRRVDIVPSALALAQAANESGWGRSRFALEANNLYGMWTWDKSQGIRPRERAEDARYFVRVFDNLRGSVGNYLHTINIGPAYREFRELRAAQRASGEALDAMKLAAGLTRYSARGEEYVDEIRAIIEYNGLHELPPLKLEVLKTRG